jgi:hypothetical protein
MGGKLKEILFRGLAPSASSGNRCSSRRERKEARFVDAEDEEAAASFPFGINRMEEDAGRPGMSKYL